MKGRDRLMAKTTYSDMYCTQCGRKNIPIQRKTGQERECGHLKKMWCMYCNKEVNMVEVRDFGSGYKKEDFYWEFENGNFDENGNRKLEFGLFRNKMNSEEKKNENFSNDGRITWLGEEHLCETDIDES